MVNLLPTIRLAQSILKRKFPSVDKPLPGAYFRNFTVCADDADADASFLGLNPGISMFRDQTPTLLGSKVSLHLFIRIIAYFAFWMPV